MEVIWLGQPEWQSQDKYHYLGKATGYFPACYVFTEAS